MEQYQEALGIYYRLQPGTKCPKCPKELLQKIAQKDRYILKCEKCKFDIQIVHPVILDLSQHEYQLIQEKYRIISETINNPPSKADFEKVKSRVEKIDSELQRPEAETASTEIFSKLVDIYFKRQELFPKLKPISAQEQEKLVNLYKEKGTSAKTPHSDWLKWFDLVLSYLKAKKELTDTVVEPVTFMEKTPEIVNFADLKKLST